MFGLFNWIRRRTAEAFAAGAADFMRAITPEGEEPPADPGELRKRLAAAAEPKALPAAKEEAAVETGGRKKATA